MAKKHPDSCVGQSTRSRAGIRLEPEFWAALDEICVLEKAGYAELVRRIAEAAPTAALTSAIRVFVLEHVRRRERRAAQREVLRLIRPPTSPQLSTYPTKCLISDTPPTKDHS